jgi:hypothetical protein
MGWYNSFSEIEEKSSRGCGCGEHNRLLDQFGNAVEELLGLHQQQYRAIVDGENECQRFDLLIHMANERKQTAKYAYLRHVESHGCLGTEWH